MKPKTISSQPIYKGRIFDVRIDDIRQGDVEYKREIVIHKGSAVIVPIYNDNTIAMVRQYRYAAGKFLLEVPAGSLDGDESPLVGATRELEEEIGVTAAKLEKIAEFYVSPGFLTELHLPVGLVNPQTHPSFHLKTQATFMKKLRSGVLQASQFPDILTDTNGTFHKPASW